MRKALIFFLLFTATITVTARHIVGGEMGYKYVGPGSAPGSKIYRIQLLLFRDALNCNSNNQCADLPLSNMVGIYNNDNNTKAVPNVNVPRVQFVPQLGIISTPACLINTPTLLYEKATYEADVELPANSSGYTVVFQTCCRVTNIENVVSNSLGATYAGVIPGSVTTPARGFDNSPAFQSGISIICYNKPFRLDFSATDVDGDNLVYSLVDAYNGGRATDAGYADPQPPPYSSVPYYTGYSGLVPLGPNATIDPNTGIISGIAPAAGKYVVCVSVKSYKDGVLIADHRKDFIITVAPCDFAVAELKPVYTSCDGFTFNFANEVVSAANQTFFWDFGDGTTSTLATPSHTYAAAGDYIIKLTVNKNNPCEVSATSVLKVYPGFFPGIGSPDSVCKNTSVPFTDATTLNYGQTNSWSWNFGDPNTLADTSHVKNPSYTFTAAGTYTVTLDVASDKGCRKTITKTIKVLDHAVLNISKDTLICAVDTLQLFASATTGGVGNYVWSPNYMISSVTAQNPFVSPDVTTTYVVNYSDNFGCTGSASVKVNVVTDVSLIAPADTVICRTDSAQLHIQSNGTAFSWTPVATIADPAVKDPVVFPTAANTVYSVTASVGGCRKTANINVRTVPYPVANAGHDTIVCFGTNAFLHGSGGSGYSWTPVFFLDNPRSADPVVIRPQFTQQYILAVRDTLGCPKPAFDTVTVQVDHIIADAGPRDTSIVTGQPLQLQGAAVGGGTIYSWSPATYLDQPNTDHPIASPPANIEYVLTVSDVVGCFDTDTIAVKVFYIAPDLLIPNAFTPGGDGLNDVFRPIAVGIKQLEYFKVFNRWGEVVFQTNKIGAGWDGRYKGREQGTAAFVWEASAIDYTGKKIVKKGSVILIQ